MKFITGPVHIVDFLALIISILALGIAIYNVKNTIEAKKHAREAVRLVTQRKP